MVRLAAAASFAVTAVIRFMEVAGFPNDHFLYIAAAQQMTFGDLPSRDFVDPGTPLMYAASAAAQIAAGSPLLAEALLVATMFGLAAALTTYAAFRASGRVSIAVLVTAVEIALFPRTYHYPKLVLHAAGILAMWWYVASPSVRRAAALAAVVVVAFLFRHDHGVYLGAAGALAVVGARSGWRGAARRAAACAAWAVVFLAPYLAFLAATTGVREHVAAGLAYSRAESTRTGLRLPTFAFDAIGSPQNAEVWLFYTFHALPVAALAIAFRRLARDESEAARNDASRVLPLAVLAMAVNVALLRDPLQARLPDVSVPACVLAAWLIRVAWPWNRPWPRVVMLAVTLTSLAAAAVVGTPLEQLDRADLLTPPTRWRLIVQEHVSRLRDPMHPRQLPSATARGMVPVLQYIDRCTAAGDRLFVAGEAPEIYVATRRPFGGGQHVLRSGYFSTLEDQQRLVQRLRLWRVPLALVLTPSDAASLFPLVMAEIDRVYVPLTEIRAHEDQIVSVRVRGDMRPRGVDAETGLPCFR